MIHYRLCTTEAGNYTMRLHRCVICHFANNRTVWAFAHLAAFIVPIYCITERAVFLKLTEQTALIYPDEDNQLYSDP